MTARHRRRWLLPIVLALGGPSAGAARADAPPGPTATFAREAVAADHELASAAGAEVLALGGTAADAAAATMLALGVVSPASSGLGGGGFALYYRASDGTTTFLDFRETAPAATTLETLARAADDPRRHGRTSSQVGGLATAVPGEPAGIDALLRRFGRLPRAAVVAPALRLATRGVPASAYVAAAAAGLEDAFRADPTLHAWLLADDGPVRAGEPLRNPALAASLRAFAREGARAFYEGAIAREIVRRVRDAGGHVTAEDLRAYTVVERAPLEGRHFGLRWVTAPPPSAGGYTLLASLALLERWIGRGLVLTEAERLHALAEAWKGPFWDRAQYVGDPDFVTVPLQELLAPVRLDARAARFSPAAATAQAAYALPLEPPGDGPGTMPAGGGTSHLCVVDGEGNVAAVTTTVNLAFGALYTAAGIVMNDEMDDFASSVGATNAFGLTGGAANLPAARKRPVSTMSPTIVLDDAGPVLCIGAAGGSRIVTATMQVALATLVDGVPLGEAVARSRIHHQGAPARLRVETVAPLDAAAREALEARGHAIEEAENNAVVQAIRVRRGATLALEAASDPRKGGRPAGR